MSESNKGCLGVLFSWLFPGPAKSTSATLPKVMVNKFFVSDAEADFFRVLQRVVGSRGHILAQVSLRQLVWFPGNNQSNPGRGTWHNKMAARSIDFVVANPATLKPLTAIELDEPTHSRPERQTRDEEVERVLEAAGLPVLRVLTSRNYDTRELEATISPTLTVRELPTKSMAQRACSSAQAHASSFAVKKSFTHGFSCMFQIKRWARRQYAH